MLVYLNLIFYGSFASYSLLRTRPSRYEPKVKILIIGPFIILLFTVIALTYNLIVEQKGECVFFGSLTALFAADIEN